jgi:hypothetical protein
MLFLYYPARNSPQNINFPVVIKAHQTTKHIALHNPKQVPLNEGQHDMRQSWGQARIQ